MTTLRKPFHLAAIALAVVALLGSCGGTGGEQGQDDVPGLTLERVDGSGTVDLSSSDGTPRVLNLWASWCAPCRKELPAFDEVAAAAGGSIEIVGVNVGDDRVAAAELVDELELDFPQLLDPDSELSAELGVTGMPSTAFIDGDGKVVELHSGAMDADELRSRISEELDVSVPNHP